jgi:hypothetical protein
MSLKSEPWNYTRIFRPNILRKFSITGKNLGKADENGWLAMKLLKDGVFQENYKEETESNTKTLCLRGDLYDFCELGNSPHIIRVRGGEKLSSLFNHFPFKS